MNVVEKCTVAILTPPGRGAVASIAIEGQDCAKLLDRFFRSRRVKTLAQSAANQIVFGVWRRANAAEEVVVRRKNDGQFEIHCHGGRAAAAAIVNDLTDAGAVAIDWLEWVQRSQPDFIAAEAVSKLADVPTRRCADLLLDQYQGALRNALQNIQTFIRMNDRQSALRSTNELLEQCQLGLHLTMPFRVVLLGPPNVGKSSLANRMLGYQRSIVFDQPGTTRDVVSAVTAFDGWPVELLDTAGVRETIDPLEAAGARRAAHAAETADLILQIDDPTTMSASHRWIAVSPVANAVRVLTKIDLLPSGDRIPEGMIGTSVVTGVGIPQLATAIVERLVPRAPEMGTALPFTARQQQLLEQLHGAMQRHDWSSANETITNMIGQRS